MSPKYRAAFPQIHALTVLPPLLELEVFPEGRALASAAGCRQIQRVLEDELRLQLHRDFRLALPSELAPEIPPEARKRIKAWLGELQAAPDLKQVSLPPSLRTYLRAQPGDGAFLILYYTGFQRSQASMTEGYHNASFRTDLVPRAFGREVEAREASYVAFDLTQGRYVALPERFHATLKWVAVDQGTLTPVYFDALNLEEDPQAAATVRALVRRLSNVMLQAGR